MTLTFSARDNPQRRAGANITVVVRRINREEATMDDGPSPLAWKIARENRQPDALVRMPTLARYVQEELDIGSDPILIAEVVRTSVKFHPRSLRYGVANLANKETQQRELDDRLGATREFPVDRGDFDEVAALIDVDPATALHWLTHGRANVTPGERVTLIEDAEVMLRVRSLQ